MLRPLKCSDIKDLATIEKLEAEMGQLEEEIKKAGEDGNEEEV